MFYHWRSRSTCVRCLTLKGRPDLALIIMSFSHWNASTQSWSCCWRVASRFKEALLNTTVNESNADSLRSMHMNIRIYTFKHLVHFKKKKKKKKKSSKKLIEGLGKLQCATLSSLKKYIYNYIYIYILVYIYIGIITCRTTILFRIFVVDLESLIHAPNGNAFDLLSENKFVLCAIEHFCELFVHLETQQIMANFQTQPWVFFYV